MARIALAANPEEVDEDALGSIAEAAQLPPGDICLVVGDPLLHEDYQAVSIPRAFTSVYGDIAGLDHP